MKCFSPEVIEQKKIEQYPKLSDFLNSNDKEKLSEIIDKRYDLSHEKLRKHNLSNLTDLNLVQICAATGKYDALQLLAKEHPEKFIQQLESETNKAHMLAAQYGHLNIFQYLDDNAPKDVQTLTWIIYEKAASFGHLPIVTYMEEKAPKEMQDLIQSEKMQDRLYLIIISAIGNGHLDVLKHLEEKAPKNVLAVIKIRFFSICTKAISRGQLDILKHLEEIAPDMMKPIVGSLHNYAVNYGGNNLPKHKKEQIKPDLVKYLEDRKKELLELSEEEPAREVSSSSTRWNFFNSFSFFNSSSHDEQKERDENEPQDLNSIRIDYL